MRMGKSSVTAQFRNPSRESSGLAAIREVSSVVQILKIWARYLLKDIGTPSNQFMKASQGVFKVFFLPSCLFFYH